MKKYYDSENKRLVYIGRRADSEMWNDRWDHESLNKLYSPKKSSRTRMTIQNITKKYLGPGSRILEGGCGLADKVYMLKQAGFSVTGVDYAKRSIRRAHAFKPELDLGCGDLRHLPFKKDSFEGYWSFGVIEHFYDGYKDIMTEMYRVIKPGGFLFLTVPVMSKLRKIKAAIGIYPHISSRQIDLSKFYQFAYDPEEVMSNMKTYSFNILEYQRLNVYKGFFDEIHGTILLLKFLRRYLDKLIWPVLNKFSSHMVLFVFKNMKYKG